MHIVIGTQQSNLLGSPPGESDFVYRVESLHFLMEDVSEVCVSGVECGCVVDVVDGEEEVRTVLYMVSRISRRLVDPLPLSFRPGPSGTESE